MKRIIFILVALLGLAACKKEEIEPTVKTEYIQEPPTAADLMYKKLMYFEYKYINNPKIGNSPIPKYDAMFDQELKGGEFVLKKGFTPYRLILMLDTANYEVLSISDTSINLNDGLYIRR